MSTFRVHDRADEFRIEIIGRFVGPCVQDVEQCWERALAEATPRTITVDISRVTGYEQPGRKLLRKMHQHGTRFAAATPRSLVFLNEITSPERRGPAPAIVRESPPASVTEIEPAAQSKAAGAGK